MKENSVAVRGWKFSEPQRVYTRRFLPVYDALVFGFNFPVLWGCRKEQLLALYNEHATSVHLDVGVGSGILLDKCRFPTSEPQITLLDNSPGSLDFVADRVRRYEPSTRLGSVLDPWEFPAGSFESVAMLNLLHCVPGTIPEKAVAFEQARAVLKPGGVLFGATVLNLGVTHTRRSRSGIAKLNRRGIFYNLGDGLEDLDAALGNTFTEHSIEMQGIVALFVARVGGGESPDAH